MLSRHNKNVARIHRLNVHEREGVGVFVTNRGLPSAVNQVAKAAMHVGLTHLALTVGVEYARLNADRMPRSGPGETAGRRAERGLQVPRGAAARGVLLYAVAPRNRRVRWAMATQTRAERKSAGGLTTEQL